MGKKTANVVKCSIVNGVKMVNENRSGNRPFVSVICPTYNRRKFLPNLMDQFNYQTYPQEFMELILLDDSPTSNEDIILKQSNIKYTYLDEKLKLGKKRNHLNSLATGDIIVCFDDDDFYAPERVAHAVAKLQSTSAKIAASSVIHIYYKNLNKILEFGPYAPNHGTNGTMAYKKEYLLTHSYLDDKDKAEEAHFTNSFSEPLIQLNPQRTMICLAHDNNTVNKDPFIERGKKTDYKVASFFKIKDKKMIDWIKNEL
jgi:glycosyltransferase involved in cell wall biosynthesis